MTGRRRAIRRILVANRGEIALRVLRACRELGLEAVAAYSEADRDSLAVRLADGAVCVGPPPSRSSYLDIGKIVEAARLAGADAIHPGYGFLSENAAFARACEEAGIAFIGPGARAIELMGDKAMARRMAAEADVPITPGSPATLPDVAAARTAAARIGYPVLLKAAAGGGGRGMRVVRDEASLAGAFGDAAREAQAAFGDGTLYVERLIERPRHIEIQVLADDHGHVLHLFERECSIQRRHQKVIEETPSVAVTPALRARMGEAAVAVARAAGYRNAGTIEFLVDSSADSFYFLEMNTRLQVEHPVTEQVVGVDLVRAQIRIAAGEPLSWTQDALTQRGHAIEARVYAEDPARDDLPQAGSLLLYREPVMPGIRIDSGVAEGSEVTVHYDPLLAKLVATGETREAARVRALDALRRFPILGIRTNVAFLIGILDAPWFASGEFDTRLLDREGEALRAALRQEPPPEVEAIASQVLPASARVSAGAPDRATRDPWMSLRGFRV